MILNKLTISGYRNYNEGEVAFTQGTNIIIGENGQGKTNLLESIYYLTGAQSFRTRYDKELIQHDQTNAAIQAQVSSEGREQTIEIRLKRGQKKGIFLNGVRQKRSADLSGKVLAVLFSPDDLELIKGGAANRRRFLDLSLSQIRPKYALWLAEFQKLYGHKTRILKDHRENPALLSTLDDFNIQLAKASAHIISYRAFYVAKLAPYADKVHTEFSGGRERLQLSYKTVSTIEDPMENKAALFEHLLTHQARLRQAEIDSGQCLSGAHKDDIEVKINGETARAFASQGQTRTAALSMKLAERDILFDDRGEYPLLLLDDVLSELDAARQDFVLNRIQSGQVFITCCEDNGIVSRTGGQIFTVKSGNVS